MAVFSFVLNTYRCPFSPVILSLFASVTMKGIFSLRAKSDMARAPPEFVDPMRRSTFSRVTRSFVISRAMSGLNLSSRIKNSIRFPRTPPFALIWPYRELEAVEHILRVGCGRSGVGVDNADFDHALPRAADPECPRKQRTLNAIMQRRNLFIFSLPAFWICPKQKGPWNSPWPFAKKAMGGCQTAHGLIAKPAASQLELAPPPCAAAFLAIYPEHGFF